MKVSPGVFRLPFLAAIALVMITGCPLPYDYSGRGAGSSHTADPSSPKVTAAVEVSYAEDGGTSGTVTDGGYFTSGKTTTVTLATATDNSIIYYTDDGSPITNVNAAKKFNGSSGIITIIRTASLQTVNIHAVAIGPNMVPSQAVQATVNVSPYPILSVTCDKASISEDGKTATFTVTSSSSPTSDITVNLKTGGDYSTNYLTGLTSGPNTTLTKTLAQGTSSISISITSIHDPSNASRTVTLTIVPDTSTPLTYSVGTPSSASVVLQDDGSYTVTYNGNGNSGGAAPTDSGYYLPGATVTVLGNTGNLVKTGFAFAGWNTQSDGTGTTYTQGQTFAMGGSNVMLYARWLPTYTVTYNANGATSGSVPVDSATYLAGATVTVMGNSGNLVKTDYAFKGWNTQADGNGTTYTQGQTFTMGSSNVTLYAKWGEKTAVVLKSYAWVGTGQRPEGMAYDGTWLWVGDVNDSKIYKINPSDGSAAASFTIITTHALSLDGAGEIWSTSYWSDPPFIYRYPLTFGSPDRSLQLTSAQDYPTAMTFDATNNAIWAVNTNSSYTRYFWKIDPTNGSVLDSWDLAGGTPYVYGLCMDSDPNYLWMVAGNTLYKVSISARQVVHQYPIPTADLLQGVAMVSSDTFWLVSGNNKLLLEIQLQ